MDEKLIGILAAAAGVAATEAAELATTDEGIATLQTKVTAKLADVKKNADGRALKIARDAFRAAGVDPEVFEEGRQFSENVTAAVDSLKAKAAADSGSALTDEQVLSHPAVIGLKNRMTLETDQKVTAAKKEAKDALQKDIDAFHKEQTMVGVRAWAEQQVDGMKPNFSTDATVAANQRKDLVDKIIAAGTYQKEGDAYVLVDDKGEIIKDTMQNPVKPEDNARKLAESYYGLPVATQRDSTGKDQSAFPGGKQAPVLKHFTGALPKNSAEFEALANAHDIAPEALKELKAYWDTTKGQ